MGGFEGRRWERGEVRKGWLKGSVGRRGGGDVLWNLEVRRGVAKGCSEKGVSGSQRV